MKNVKAIFFDFEVFKYDWLVCITEMYIFNNSVKEYSFTILNNSSQLKKYYEENKDCGIFIGKNNSRYDNGIMVSLLESMNPKAVSDKIIVDDISWKRQIKNWRKYPMLYIDIMQDAARISLKEEEAYLDLPIVTTEVEFNLDRPLTKDELLKTIEYCKADVKALIVSFMNNIEGIMTKLDIIKTYGLSIRDISLTNAQLVSKLFECKKTEYDDELIPFDINCLGIIPQNKTIIDFYKQPIDYKKSLNISVAGVPHTFAYGGLHGAIENFIYHGEIWLIDVASYYPSLMIYYDFLSRSMSDKGKKMFVEMYFKRLQVKSRNKNELLQVLDKQKALFDYMPQYGIFNNPFTSDEIDNHKADKHKSQTLKLPLNTFYGILKAKFNNAFDPHNSNNICIAGQLMLISLVELLEPYGKIIQSNTDGILIIPENKEKIKEIISYWEEKNKMTMELDIAHSFIQKDVNNYILFVDNNNEDTKSLINDCESIINIEIIDLLKEFKNIYNVHDFITDNKLILKELAKDIPSNILDKYYLKHLNFYAKINGKIYLYAHSIKSIGGFTAQYCYNGKVAAGAQLRNSLSAVDDAVCNYFLFDIPVETTLNYTLRTKPTRFKQIVKSGPTYQRQEWFKDGKYIQLGKINRVYASTNTNHGQVYKIKENAIEKKTGRVYNQIVKFQETSSNSYIDNDLSFDFKNLDLKHYVDIANSRIQKYKSKEKLKKGNVYG